MERVFNFTAPDVNYVEIKLSLKNDDQGRPVFTAVRDCEYLKQIGLYRVKLPDGTEYKYGDSRMCATIPQDDLNKIRNLITSMTNFEAIRKMSEKELACFLNCVYTTGINNGPNGCGENPYNISWLNSQTENAAHSVFAEDGDNKEQVLDIADEWYNERRFDTCIIEEIKR